MKLTSVIVVAVALIFMSTAATHVEEPESRTATPKVDFSRDIRPILSDTCYKCHGPDEGHREADLRLDSKASVFDESMCVEPGDAESSELYLRLIESDHDLLMPPPDSGRKLTQEQIDLIKLWINQGAQWGEHWSFVSPVAPSIPDVVNKEWPQNGIDFFVLSQLERDQMSPAGYADKVTILRRIYLDLIGMPPTPEQADEFLNDTSPDAYDKLVDQLLASPHYGEHMARFWLDAARYGDTHGLHLDNYREHWPYRDWIINAFNSNLSFKDFSVEQLAGDLLEDPSQAQLIATGFNRANVTTAEGGSIKEEVRVRNVVDRVSTMGTVFMGLTLGCGQCHDHKFDPISMKEFYQLYAYFNAFDGDPMDGNRKDHAPVLLAGTDEQMNQLDDFEKKIAANKKLIQETVANWEYVEPDDPPAVTPDPVDVVWVDDEAPATGNKTGDWKFEASDEEPAPSGKLSIVKQSDGFFQNVVQGVSDPWVVTDNDILFAHVYLDPDNPPRQIMLQWNDGNWEHRVYWGENLINFGQDNTPSRKLVGPLPKLGQWVQLRIPAKDVNLQPGAAINGFALSQWDGKVSWDRIGKVTRPTPFPRNRSFADWQVDIFQSKGSGLPGPIKAIAEVEIDKRNEQQVATLKKHFIEHVYAGSRETFEKLHADQKKLVTDRDGLKNTIPTTLIYREKAEPGETFILNRGKYDLPGEKVQRAVPGIFEPIPSSLSNDRLGLANWLFSDDHPLTSRVIVNRVWQQFFGRGIVETSEDFGSQGQFPSHPDLLDHLATEFRKHDWDMKWLVKYIAMSATYRQTSKVGLEKYQQDPANRFLARGPRYRLDAEMLRDQSLLVSELLVMDIGGPSVKPPQPDGLWFAVGYSGSNTVRFKKDEGHEKVHRRSLYTFWKRTSPPPQMSAFDAPSRESCTVRRERTNTPLQALLLMNETQYVETARSLALVVLEKHADATDEEKIIDMFRRCLVRKPSSTEIKIIAKTLKAGREKYESDVESAKALLQIGETPANVESEAAAELATWTMVASLIMNMDEFLTKN